MANLNLPRNYANRWIEGSGLWLTLAAVSSIVLIGIQTGEIVFQNSAISSALAATLVTALATGAGAIPALFLRQISGNLRDICLGFGAGIMLAASFLSLIAPALAAGIDQSGTSEGGITIVLAGLALGALVMITSCSFLPKSEHTKNLNDINQTRISRTWLFVFAITLHNFPEGLAVGVAQANGTAGAGALTLGIALQNMPEGLIVATALLGIGHPPNKAILLAFLTGMVEPLGGLFGATMVTIATGMLPWSLAFAAGAMLYIITKDIIPESRRHGNHQVATGGILAGIIVMILLSTLLS
jgi:ZIP family zinc transporter